MKRGFATIVVLIVSMALSTAVITFWHHVSNSIDISIEHERSVQLTGYVECIISYGVKIAYKHFDLIHRELGNRALSFNMNDVMVQLGGMTGAARLTFNKPTLTHSDRTGIIINGIVEQGDYKCHIRCLLIKQKNNDQFCIDGYTFVTSF